MCTCMLIIKFYFSYFHFWFNFFPGTCMISKKLKKGVDIKRDVSMLQVSMKCSSCRRMITYEIKILIHNLHRIILFVFVGISFQCVWFQGYKTVLKTKQFFVQFLTSIKIWLCSSSKQQIPWKSMHYKYWWSHHIWSTFCYNDCWWCNKFLA